MRKLFDWINSQVLKMEWLSNLITLFVEKVLGLFVTIVSVGIVIIGYGFNYFSYMFV